MGPHPGRAADGLDEADDAKVLPPRLSTRNQLDGRETLTAFDCVDPDDGVEPEGAADAGGDS